MGLSLLEPQKTYGYCLVLDKNSGYYITYFQNILVGWEEGGSSSWSLLPEEDGSTCEFATYSGRAGLSGSPTLEILLGREYFLLSPLLLFT